MGKSTGTLSDLVTWLFMTNQGVVINNNGTLQKTFSFLGEDQSCMEEDERDFYILQLNNVIKRLPSGYQLYVEAQKEEDVDYMELTSENELTRILDEERRKRLSGTGNYKIRYFLTIVYKQPIEAIQRFGNLIDKDNKELIVEVKKMLSDFVHSINPRSSNKDLENRAQYYAKNLNLIEETFLDQIDSIVGVLKQYFRDITELSPQKTLSYLHSTISDRWYSITSPIRYYITEQLSDSTFLTGREPKLGEHHLGILGIKDLPQEMHPFVFDMLNSFNSRYRFCIRYLALDKIDAKKEAESIAHLHKNRSKSIVTNFFEVVTNQPSNKVDESAIMDQGESLQASVEIEQGEYSLGYMTLNIVLLNEDKTILDNELKALRALLDGKGFISTIEKDNAPEAWLSTIPSCFEYNVRKYLVDTLTVSACLPSTAMWEGQKKNPYFEQLAKVGLQDESGQAINIKGLQSMALMKCKTPESLPFYFNLHFGEVGHTFIAGATGTGKSVLLNAIASNFQKYKNSRVYIFDKSASSRVLTQAMGGNFYNMLIDTKQVAFQPLSQIHEPTEQIWVHGWLCRYAEQKNVKLTPTDERDLANGLKSMALQPIHNRTITVLSSLTQNETWRIIFDELMMTTRSGSEGLYGHLFDSTEDKFGTGNWQVFEMEKLMANEAIVAPTLDYLFHRIESQLTGYPTLIILDECWLFLRNEAFRKKIVEYLKDLRKKNASVIMATQNLSDITDDILPIIVENMSTKIMLANYTMNQLSREMYRKFGLNEEEIETVRGLIPKEQYFYKSPLGTRVFGLDIAESRSPIEYAFLTATSKIDQQKAEELSNLSPSEFIKAWKYFKLGVA